MVGLRVLHLSAGPFGSAVAELLAALVPLQRDLGIRADWRVLRCDPPAAWLALYEGLSGGIAIGRPPAEASVAGPADPWDIRRAAEEYDVILVHDPQLVELADLVPASRAVWFWHCHLDLRAAQQNVWARVSRWLRRFAAVLLPDAGFLPHSVDLPRYLVSGPILDPCSPRNVPLPERTLATVLSALGIDPNRPIIGQFAPIGQRYASMAALGAFWLARPELPGLQLVMGDSSPASPEAGSSDEHPLASERQEVLRAAASESDIHLFGAEELSAAEVAALQQASAVALQMAVPRGFSAGVLECQWKSRPCVVGRDGQLPDQVAHGQAGVVVEGAPEAAGRIIEFVTRPDLAANMAQRARQRVAGKHLITGLLGEYTVLLQQLAEAAPLSGGDLICSMV